MRRPELSDAVTLVEDVGCKLLDSKWTPIVLAVLVAFAFGFLIGIELIRAVTG